MPSFKPLDKKIDPEKCMGDWYVQYGIYALAMLEKNSHNNLENYAMDKNGRVTVTYTFNSGSFDGKISRTGQKGRVAPGDTNGTHWQVKPIIGCCTAPFWLDYYIVDVADDYSYLSCVGPAFGSYWCYIMTRQQVVDDATLTPLVQRLKDVGVDTDKLIRIPQRA